MKKLVLTVGNGMMGDDAAGPLLAAAWSRSRQPPGNCWMAARRRRTCSTRSARWRPQEVLVVDAADMDLAPGEIRFVGDDPLEDPFLMTTHSLPLSYLMQSLQEFVPKVSLLGIQPRPGGFGYPISVEV